MRLGVFIGVLLKYAGNGADAVQLCQVGDPCNCPQMVSFLVCCKWFRWAVLPLDGTLGVEIYRSRDLKSIKFTRFTRQPCFLTFCT